MKHRVSSVPLTVLVCWILSLSFELPIQAFASTATNIDAGLNHTCAVLRGTVWCWGNNDYGNLGNGTTTTSLGATRVLTADGTALTGVAQISTSFIQSCALRSGNVYCWGSADLPGATTATKLLFLDGSAVDSVSKISVGGSFICFLRKSRVWCADISENTPPVEIRTKTSPLIGVTDVSVGDETQCALASGYVWCWGSGVRGALGTGSTLTRSHAERVKTKSSGLLSNVRLIASGYQYNCAIRTDNSTWCWGRNDDGQLCNAKAEDQTKAVNVKCTYILTGKITQLSGGTSHMCALANGSIECWGNYSLARFSPSCCGITAFENKNIISMAAGQGQTCAVKTNTIWCWGSNRFGELGDGTLNMNPQSASLVRFANYSVFR